MTAPRPQVGTTAFERGWHEGVGMAKYLADGAVSASLLWKLHSSTPAHLRHQLEHGSDKPTDAKELGTLVHTRVFEADAFDARYVVVGPCEARLKSGERKGELCGKQGSIYRDGQSFCGVTGHDPYGKVTPVDTSVHTVAEPLRDQAIRMADSLWRHPTASEILGAAGPREVTGVWRDESTGLWARMRPDLRIDAPRATPERYHWSSVNLKSTAKSAAPAAFQRDFLSMGHAFRAAFYRMGLRALQDVEPQNFLFPVVEAGAPYEVVVYRLHEDWIDVSEPDVRYALNTLAECIESGRWPGYGPGIHHLDMPDWMRRRIDHTDFLEVA